MTQTADKNMPFREGQRWENPDGLCMHVCAVKDGWVHYLTDEGQFGKETVHHMQEWLDGGAITQAGAI